jgi:DNA-binding HxlR family transcriptional regulator
MPAARDATFGPCPITPVVDIIFGKWTTPILWSLNMHGRQRFGELQSMLPGITPKVLTQRLRQLEQDGLVQRTYHAEMPPRVEYSTTPLARTLAPVFTALLAWSGDHLEDLLAARANA